MPLPILAFPIRKAYNHLGRPLSRPLSKVGHAIEVSWGPDALA